MVKLHTYAFNDQKVGQITIDSNKNGGFKISFSSARSGYLGLDTLVAGTEASHQKIGYLTLLQIQAYQER